MYENCLNLKTHSFHKKHSVHSVYSVFFLSIDYSLCNVKIFYYNIIYIYILYYSKFNVSFNVSG